MIPGYSASADVVPATSGKLTFHVIVDDFNSHFSMDGPEGPNGVRLHYEMVRVMRGQKKRLRDFELWADSHEAAIAQMTNYFPTYKFQGSWANVQSK